MLSHQESIPHRKFYFLFIVLFCIFPKTALPQNSLLGSWQCISGSEMISVQFQSENLLIFDGQPANYLHESGTLKIQEDYGLVDYNYVLQGNNLSILFPVLLGMDF